MDRDQLVRRYCDLRSSFDELVTFVEAARQKLGRDSPLFMQCDPDNWIAEMQAYQESACQRCGAFLQYDALGHGAYAIEPFSRIYASCFGECAPCEQHIQPRLARLTAYAQEQPQLCVRLLVEV